MAIEIKSAVEVSDHSGEEVKNASICRRQPPYQGRIRFL